ncbi:MAG: hypothetical protein HOF99_08920, partial [Rhodospirillaceae bacterium]|nr:hypothetical protein [Rhodospirillaceae bacterium]
MSPKHTLRVAAVLLLMGLTACAGIESERADADDFEDKDIKSGGKLFGDINLLGGGDDEP